MAKKEYSLAHTKWMCKYHIVFTPKYRRKIIYNQYKADIRDIIKQLCSYKGVEIIEGHLMPDHIHMLVSIPSKMSVSSFMGYLKGKSALMIFDKHANLKYKFGNRHFWAEGYYVSTVVIQALWHSAIRLVWIMYPVLHSVCRSLVWQQLRQLSRLCNFNRQAQVIA